MLFLVQIHLKQGSGILYFYFLFLGTLTDVKALEVEERRWNHHVTGTELLGAWAGPRQLWLQFFVNS